MPMPPPAAFFMRFFDAMLIFMPQIDVDDDVAIITLLMLLPCRYADYA